MAEQHLNPLSMLDIASDIGREELRALQQGDVDEAESLSTRRFELMDIALKQVDQADLREFRKRLQAFQAQQEMITAEAIEQRRQLGGQIMQTKHEARRHKAYGQSVRQAL